MRVYVAGPIAGRTDYQDRFARASDGLRQRGYSVYNPAAANLEGMPLTFIMAHLLPQLCECQAIAPMRGWWRSGGARIECLLAYYLGLKFIWL